MYGDTALRWYFLHSGGVGKCSSSLRQVAPAESSSASQMCPHEDEPMGLDEVMRKQKSSKAAGRKPGAGKPLQLTKTGKEQRMGRGGMITIWQKMQVIKKYERLQAAGFTSPEKHMSSTSSRAASRKADGWDLAKLSIGMTWFFTCQTSPKICERFRTFSARFWDARR